MCILGQITWSHAICNHVEVLRNIQTFEFEDAIEMLGSKFCLWEWIRVYMALVILSILVTKMLIYLRILEAYKVVKIYEI